MFEQAFKNIDDVLWKDAGCTSELDYTEQTSWLLFLKYLDALETEKAMEAQLDGRKYTFILDKPYRWKSWAAPKSKDGTIDHNGGECYTPRPLERTMIQVVRPKLGETIYDGAVGSAGFHCEVFEYLKRTYPNRTTAQDRALQERTFYG